MLVVTDKNAPDYTHADWTIVPSYCPVDYTYAYAPAEILPGVTAISQSGKTFSFKLDQELSDYNTAEQVTTITGTSNSIYNPSPNTKNDAKSFKLTFKDPCLENGFVTITPATG